MPPLSQKMKQWKVKERGFASTALIIIALPLIIGAFGFGFDALRLSYAKRYLQGRLDVATQAGASVVYTNPQGNVRLGEPGDGQRAVEEAEEIYIDNTNEARPVAGTQSLIDCTVAEIANQDNGCLVNFRIVGTPPGRNTDFCSPDRDDNEIYGLRGRAADRVDTVFLHIIGVDSWDFEVESESVFRYGDC